MSQRSLKQNRKSSYIQISDTYTVSFILAFLSKVINFLGQSISQSCRYLDQPGFMEGILQQRDANQGQDRGRPRTRGPPQTLSLLQARGRLQQEVNKKFDH